MNTANLQLEGVYAAMSTMLAMLRDKGMLTVEEIEHALTASEARLREEESKQPTGLSPAHLDAICFPLRYLRMANQLNDEASFREIARTVGLTKSDDC